MNLQTLAFIVPIALLLGNFIGLFLLWYSSREAVRNYPELRIRVPENAEDSSEWQAWARQNGYKRKNSGVWAKGRAYSPAPPKSVLKAATCWCRNALISCS